MTQQYLITNHIVDVARNQIIRDPDSEQQLVQILPPKTIMVLTTLVKSQGGVVSHQQLMDSVWADTVVSPNSIQRCITELRKALADSGKQQSVIKTHAKQGYSLEVPATFIAGTTEPSAKSTSTPLDISDVNERELEVDNAVSKETQLKTNNTDNDLWNNKIKIIALFSFIMLIGFIYRDYFSAPRGFSFKTLTPITSSDNLERNASYSPDGKFVLFHRYDGLCDNNIWAKEIATAKEHKLTSTYGFYSDHSFNAKGDKLAFMAKISCKKNKEIATPTQAVKKQKECWNLMTLNFNKALKSSQKPELVLSCDEGSLSNPIWLNNGNIIALNHQSALSQVLKLMPSAPQYVPIHISTDKNYYHLTFSRKSQQIIVLGINTLNEHVIDILNAEGDLLSSHQIKRPAMLSPYKMIEPILDPKHEQLLFSTGKQLFSLSFTGEVKHISTLSHNNLSTIKMNHSGDAIVAVQGVVDRDIAQVSLENLKAHKTISLSETVNFNQVHQPYPSIARSIAEDFDAHYQPDGELIAFISARSGVNQLWIKHNEQLIQLTDFPIDSMISNLVWNPSGTSIMLVVNSELFNVYLDKTIEKIPVKSAVLNVFQWQKNDDLLMNIRQGGKVQLAKFNVTSQQTKVLLENEIKWALNTEDDSLIYLDRQNVFWEKNAQGAQTITTLKDQFGSPRFIVRKGILYSINKDKFLWAYTLKNNSFEILAAMDSYTQFISDLKGADLLLTQTISAKKEVVILSD